MAKTNGRKALLVVLVVLACGGTILLLREATRRLDPFEVRPFDSAAWAAADHEGRATMARDAIRHLPPGTPEADIEPLLGRPAEVIETPRLTASYPRGSARTYSYYLGCWSVRYYDSTFLWVHIGVDGRVVEAVIGGG